MQLFLFFQTQKLIFTPPPVNYIDNQRISYRIYQYVQCFYQKIVSNGTIVSKIYFAVQLVANILLYVAKFFAVFTKRQKIVL